MLILRGGFVLWGACEGIKMEVGASGWFARVKGEKKLKGASYLLFGFF